MIDDADAGPDDGSYGESETLFRDLKGEIRLDAEKHGTWRKLCVEWNGLYANDQWDAEALKVLKEELRPTVSMNHIQKSINAVAGHEISNRQEIHCIPREEGDAAVAEIVTAGVKWYRDEAFAEDEESTAFKDVLIAGMGWTELRLDHDMDPDGAPQDNRIDPMEMIPDRYATQANLADAQRVSRIRCVPRRVAQQMFPDAQPHELDAAWARGYVDEDTGPERSREEPAYQDEGASSDDRDPTKEVTLVECQWSEREVFYRIAEPIMEPVVGPPGMDPMTGQPMQPGPMLDEMGQPVMQQTGERMVSLSAEEYEDRKEALAGLPTQKAHRICRYRAILGSKGFLEGPVKMEGPDPADPSRMLLAPSFSYTCITGNWDAKNKYWFGLVAPMADPQRWANKFFSQILHIINSTAKGGVMVEEDVLDDIRDFEASWARVDAVTKVPRGAMNPAMPKIQPKPQTPFPAGVYQMMQLAYESIGEATGISQELLGMRNASQPGVLEAQRTQRGLTILARYFDSLRRFRMMKGRHLVYLLQTQIPDGRLVRIVGDGKEEYVRLFKSEMSGTYDIKVDETPTSPSVKDRTWAMIAPMYEKLPPQIQMELLPYSPLPESAVMKITGATQKLMEQSQNQPDPKMEAAKAQLELEQAKFTASMQMKEAEFAANQRMEQEKAAAEHQRKTDQAAADFALAKQRMEQEFQIEQMRLEQSRQLETYKAQLAAANDARRIEAEAARPMMSPSTTAQ